MLPIFNLGFLDRVKYREAFMKRNISKLAILAFTLAVILPSVVNAAPPATPTPKPLWTKGKYYGGYPTIDKYLTQGIVFRIAPDKITMKDISIEFPAECYDENNVPSPRSIHFSEVGIEPLTLERTSREQQVSFAYLDEFDRNWNTDLKIKWNRAKQSFRIQISSITDYIEGTHCKADAIVAKGAIKGRPGIMPIRESK